MKKLFFILYSLFFILGVSLSFAQTRQSGNSLSSFMSSFASSGGGTPVDTAVDPELEGYIAVYINYTTSGCQSGNTRLLTYGAHCVTNINATIILQGWVTWPTGIANGQCGGESYFRWQENTTNFEYSVPNYTIYYCPQNETITHLTNFYAGFNPGPNGYSRTTNYTTQSNGN
jgi:hypothetical protein